MPGLARQAVPGHLAAPFRIEQILIGLRLSALRHQRGIEAGRVHEQVVGDPVAFGVLIQRPDSPWRFRLPLQDVAFLLQRHHGRWCRRKCRPARLPGAAFVEDLHRDLGRIGAGRSHLDAGIFLLESRRHRAHELADDLGRIPDDLALLLGCLDRSQRQWRTRSRSRDRQAMPQPRRRLCHGVVSPNMRRPCARPPELR